MATEKIRAPHQRGELGSGNKSRQVSADELTRRLFAPGIMGGFVAQLSRSIKTVAEPKYTTVVEIPLLDSPQSTMKLAIASKAGS